MKRFVLSAILAVTLPLFAQQKVVVGYYPEWAIYARDYHVPDIPAEHLTHLLYAFARITDGSIALADPYADIDRFYPGDCWDAGCLRGSFHQLQILKQQHPALRTSISVGGWTQSGGFSDVALSPASRGQFAHSCAVFLQQYEFDGVDIDREYPVCCGLPGNTYRPEDRHDFTLLMQALRQQLDSLGLVNNQHYFLTFAAHALMLDTHYELNLLAPVVDWINVMTYDFHGSWDDLTNFNSPLFASPSDPTPPPTGPLMNADAAITAYLTAGVPADKLVLGLAFYGTGFANVTSANNGLYQSFSGSPPGTWEAGTFDYWDLAANYVNLNGYARFWQDDAQAPWLYNPTAHVMISYDDSMSIARKGAYVLERDLRGAMFWELAADRDGVLLRVIDHAIRCQCHVATTLGRYAGNLRLRFQPDAQGTYRIWSTSNRNNDGDPDGGADTDWALAAELNVSTLSTVVWPDPNPLSAYRNYVVTRLCP